ncbi:hypothetical protein PoB_006165600 [Plakobranchus ocellatus]|uniref:Uncharacterized protein n=1 Tax=Plakobranchus ocellatus TaxID=259542 RepID=A0AAV4CTF5_9GAST|nr:hypothetical protein PoB_006165600 [Plakobranchus ocellatus]
MYKGETVRIFVDNSRDRDRRYGQGESTQVQRGANIASAVGQFASAMLFGNSDRGSASTVGQFASAMGFGDSDRNRGSTRGHFASLMRFGDSDSDSDSDTPQSSGIRFTFF